MSIRLKAMDRSERHAKPASHLTHGKIKPTGSLGSFNGRTWSTPEPGDPAPLCCRAKHSIIRPLILLPEQRGQRLRRR
ncbi:hypothetical protein IBA8403_04480 [Pseudomonas syringae]